jgi:hypothetical protein
LWTNYRKEKKMSKRIPYEVIMNRIKSDVDSLAEEVYKKGYDLGFEEGKAAAPFADTKRAEEVAYKRGYQAAMENMRKAEKTADKEQDWILCSEKQPEINGWYLTTVSGQVCGQDHPFSGISEFANGRWVSGDDVDETEIVIAWMPMPDPYQAEEEAYKRGYRVDTESKRKAEESAEVHRFILCSERPPKTNGWYITMVNHPICGISEYTNGRWISRDGIDETKHTIAWVPVLDIR